MGVCISCGQQIDEGSLFCPFCAAPQQPQQPPQPQQQTVYPTFPEAKAPESAYQRPNFVEQDDSQPQSFEQPQAPQQNFGQPQAAAPQGGFPQQNFGQPQTAAPQPNYGQPQQGFQQGAPQQGFGQPQQAYAGGGYPQQPAYKAPGQNPLSKIPKPVLIIVPIVIILAIVAVIIFSNLRGASSYTGAVKDFFAAMDSGKSDKLMKVMFPKQLESAAKKELGGDAVFDTLGYLGSYISLIDIKNDKIIEKEHADKSDISDFEDELNDEFNTHIKISDMYYVTAEAEISFEGSSLLGDLYSETEEMDFVVYKVSGRWYAFPD